MNYGLRMIKVGITPVLLTFEVHIQKKENKAFKADWEPQAS